MLEPLLAGCAPRQGEIGRAAQRQAAVWAGRAAWCWGDPGLLAAALR
jgi:hypothetical protein